MEEKMGLNIDSGQLEKILSVVKLMNNMNNTVNTPVSGEASEKLQLPSSETVEKMDGNTALKKIKDAIPFLDMPYQKNLGLVVKIMEIDKLVNNFKAMSVSGENNSRLKKQMLMAIRPELDNRKQKMVDVFVRVMEITDIVEGLRNE